ncbi:MAG TPA: hypothetical protein VNU26_04030 [Mycobacteriales bacterium]|nr:hypothetical protein [Mycobacteriales bacterium]
MTTIPASPAPISEAPSRTPLLAALALGTAIVLNAVGTFWDVTGNSDKDHGWSDFLFVVGVSVVATAVVFGLVVRTAADGDPGRRALVLGVLAALSFVVFWLGISAPVAIGAIGCALVARDVTGRLGGTAAAGAALGALALAAVTVLAVVG